ncbi:hypothetical protein RJ639_033736 [Escallonia herrerae]|uniref:Exostosin GT47 domain-containing protein n=1 Tax=Escallonia herrerae TaxID=1293975 RepID=A0AA89BK87_9ASTE|nr:hypothetical protein RJ639_033736 [Escallonia herrerae]
MHKPAVTRGRGTCRENVRVFVYKLPAKFNLEILQDCRHLNLHTNMCPHIANCGLGRPLGEVLGAPSSSWFATHQLLAEMIFHARLENHPCRTLDPEGANLYYVPFYGGLDASNRSREVNFEARDALAIEFSDFIRSQKWWQRNNGKDHFIALGRTAWDFVRNDGGNDYGANRLLYMPSLRIMSVLLVERQPREGPNQYGVPYPSTLEEVSTWQHQVRVIDRPHLFSFVGATRTGVKRAAIRDDIVRQCNESSLCKLLKCDNNRGGSKCHDPSEVLNVMIRSIFCIQATGDSFTRRSTFDSFLTGCIPVFFSPHTAYTQYTWYLPTDPNSFSVYIEDKGGRNSSNTKSMDIEQELVKIPKDKVETMRKRVIDLIPTLTYMHPNSTEDFGFRDIIDVALASLSKHVKSRRLPL